MLKQNKQTKRGRLALNKKMVASLTFNQQQIKLIAGGNGLGLTSLPGGRGGPFCTTHQPPTSITIVDTIFTTDVKY